MTSPTAPTVAQLRLICVALLLGALIFGALVALVAPHVEGSDGPDLRLLWIIGLVYTIMGVAAAFVLRTGIWGKIADQEAAARQQTYATGTLVFMALLESCVLLNCVFWMITGSALPSAALAAAVFLLALLRGMPSESQFEALGGMRGGG
jgi:hypothetical protein